jgi:mono/diheme cytochrome c family protein
MMIRHGWGALALVLASVPVAAQDLPGDPAAGQRIAEGWCAECHETEAGFYEEGLGGAPAFQTVADLPAATEMALRAFLQSPHANMPSVQPTPEQTDDIIAYILSLKGR